MCKVPVGGDLWIHKVQGAVGWELTPEGQGQAARGSWVMGHGSWRGVLSLFWEQCEPWECCRQGRGMFRVAP